MEQTTSPRRIAGTEKEYGHSEDPSIPRAYGRWMGALFLAAFALYGVGSLLIERVTRDGATADEILRSQAQLRMGALLIIANSIAVVAIGVLMYRVATAAAERHVRLGYLGSRVLESVFLALGAVFALMLIPLAESADANSVNVLTEGGNVAYQIGMIGLCVGSIPLFLALTNSQALPKWLGLWGVVGYTIFGAGAALEILGVTAGVIMSIPGGIFEVTFAVYLLWKGVLGPSRLNSAEGS
jgi:hypothetical protein